MSRPLLAISRKIFPDSLALLQQHFVVRDNQADTLFTPAQLVAHARGAQALFIVASDKIDQPLLAQLPDLKLIATGSVGTNHIDLAACAAASIVVSNTPDVLTEATADMAWALLMAAARRVTESERWLRAGHWHSWAFDQFLGASVHRATLGLVGMGRIGSAIARRASGFEMRVIYHNRSASTEAAALGATLVSKEQLLAQADFVVLVLPYSAQSHHWLNAAAIAQLKPSAVLVNIARGGIVDDGALATALASGKLAAAGLDVFENEPALNPALLALNNVVLTPHIGSATIESRGAMALLAAKNCVAWQQGLALLTPVQLST
jgi:glyoxylate/hydroxypyruvate/2-ketogluconate reductase